MCPLADGGKLIKQAGLFGLCFGNRGRFRTLIRFLPYITDTDIAADSQCLDSRGGWRQHRAWHHV